MNVRTTISLKKTLLFVLGESMDLLLIVVSESFRCS